MTFSDLTIFAYSERELTSHFVVLVLLVGDKKAVPHPKCLLGAFGWLAHSDGGWRIRMDIRTG